ncbi:MAG: response regulator, partial [Rhodothermales bacterium]
MPVGGGDDELPFNQYSRDMDTKKPKILFVDDEQLLHSLFDRLFSRSGMEVKSCLNAEQAMEALESDPYDLVVTDFMMPDMD